MRFQVLAPRPQAGRETPCARTGRPHRRPQVVSGLNGLRNRDLQPLLYNPGPLSKRRRSAAIGRKLRLLRMHGILQKVPHTHRYQVTAAGRLALSAILTVDRASLTQLTQLTQLAA